MLGVRRGVLSVSSGTRAQVKAKAQVDRRVHASIRGPGLSRSGRDPRSCVLSSSHTRVLFAPSAQKRRKTILGALQKRRAIRRCDGRINIGLLCARSGPHKRANKRHNLCSRGLERRTLFRHISPAKIYIFSDKHRLFKGLFVVYSCDILSDLYTAPNNPNPAPIYVFPEKKNRKEKKERAL